MERPAREGGPFCVPGSLIASPAPGRCGRSLDPLSSLELL